MKGVAGGGNCNDTAAAASIAAAAAAAAAAECYGIYQLHTCTTWLMMEPSLGVAHPHLQPNSHTGR